MTFIKDLRQRDDINGLADILNYPQTKGVHKKRTMYIFIFKVDPPFVIGCLTANLKTRIPNPLNGVINASSQKRLYHMLLPGYELSRQ